MHSQGLLDFQRDLLPRAWWVKIETELPCCIYYFGPFDTAIEAQSNRGGYVADLEAELASGIHTEIDLYQPQILTIDCA
jgi:hypothetical protein